MKSIRTILFVLVGSIFTLAIISVGNYEVGQRNKSFTLKTLDVKVGEQVRFTNQDPFFHNVFSLSDAKTFDLGSYPRGKFKTVTFDQVGIVEVECAIHPTMQMTINVKK